MNAVDTNVLVYACDGSAGSKQVAALDLIERLDDGVIPWQVACEFIAASRKLAVHGLTIQAAWERLDQFAKVLRLVTPDTAALDRARQLHLRGISFWDALIIGACLEAGVTTLYTEDIPGTSVQGLAIVNPFAA